MSRQISAKWYPLKPTNLAPQKMEEFCLRSLGNMLLERSSTCALALATQTHLESLKEKLVRQTLPKNRPAPKPSLPPKKHPSATLRSEAAEKSPPTLKTNEAPCGKENPPPVPKTLRGWVRTVNPVASRSPSALIFRVSRSSRPPKSTEVPSAHSKRSLRIRKPRPDSPRSSRAPSKACRLAPHSRPTVPIKRSLLAGIVRRPV